MAHSIRTVTNNQSRKHGTHISRIPTLISSTSPGPQRWMCLLPRSRRMEQSRFICHINSNPILSIVEACIWRLTLQETSLCSSKTSEFGNLSDRASGLANNFFGFRLGFALGFLSDNALLAGFQRSLVQWRTRPSTLTLHFG